MSESTAARPTTEQSCHWYHRDGRACYEVPRASGDGMRPTTLADARKLSLLPSVTTILGVLHKEALVQWRVEQAVLACLTSPKRNDEPLDDFTKRILHTEKVQDQESDVAKRRGTEIHDALEGWANGQLVSDSMLHWVEPVLEFLDRSGEIRSAEKIVVSLDGYAGRTDLIQETDTGLHIWDFKTTKKLPTKSSWTEHGLQLAAYANAYDVSPSEKSNISTGNIYISTVEPGKFAVFENEPWFDVYQYGFKPLLTHWQWSNNYRP